jgi:acetylornithine deacetylase/succinyl-diaminopimelate desuccinylase-like protein
MTPAISPLLREEVTDLAQRLIRIDTSNPPGRETPAAELLLDYLSAAGAECELAGPDPERLNLVARVPGGDGPSMMLLAHTDVVPAPDANWTVHPFEGVVRDGLLIGRGAADMKGELAARAVALAEVARAPEPPPGDVVLVAEADEERNVSDVGLSWLVRERPDIRCDFAVNEGGGILLELPGGRRVVTIAIGEKRVTSLRVRMMGRASHASVPSDDNPVAHAASAALRLLDHQAPAQLVPAVANALVALGAPKGADDEALVSWAAAQHQLLDEMVPAMARLMITPTGLEAGEPANVIPPFADLICDCRALPGQDEADIRSHIAAAIGDDLSYEVEFLEPLAGGTESPTETALFEACRSYVAARLPGAELLPVISTGFTDSHWIREAYGTVAYGFAPVFAMDPILYEAGAHGADEALAVDDLVEMTEFNLYAIRELAAVRA